jgi:hypothetical protein
MLKIKERSAFFSRLQMVATLEEKVLTVSLTVRMDNIIQDSYLVLKNIFNWNREQVELVQCTDGITNQLVKAKYIPTNETILIRTYGRGSGIIIDREQEIKVSFEIKL